MKFKAIILTICFLTYNAYGWGLTGHRVVAKIAENHLSRKASKKIKKLLKNESLVEVSTWMDEIKSDKDYDHMRDWHWVTVPDSIPYFKTKMNKNGDIYVTLLRIIAELESHQFSKKEEREKVKMLVHLVGDIHQPLHVGNGKDLGGNKTYVKWFGKSSNLHKVWDSEMIDGKKWSYTELAENIDEIPPELIQEWQNEPIEIWIQEAIALRKNIYDLPENNKIGYDYQFENWPLVKLQLVKSGIRLAGILNRIYG